MTRIEEVITLLKKLAQILESRRRGLAYSKIRREFARAGYPLDQFRDSQIAAALRHRNNDIGAVTINAKTIYLTLKRLNGNLRKGKIQIAEPTALVSSASSDSLSS